VSRRGLVRRLEALEALGRADKWPFRLEDGRTVFVPVLAVLAVFTESLDWCHDDFSDQPQPGEGSRGPFSHHLELLSQAVASPDDSMFAASVVHIARRAREHRDAAIPGQVDLS
jgi:hypothetical protein